MSYKLQHTGEEVDRGVGGGLNSLQKPSEVLASNELVGVGVDGEQVRIQLGEGLILEGSESPYLLTHSNSITAQTTQEIYPIKIDAHGHIAAYGTAQTIPTKTSDLTNNSDFITSNYHDNTKQDTLTAGNGITLQNNVISALSQNKLFAVTRGSTTYAQITTAINDGLIPYIPNYDGGRWYLTQIDGGWYVFATLYGYASNYVRVNSDNTWQNGYLDLNWEARKVTSITSASTDNQMPTAKAVYDFVMSKLGT